MSALTPTEIGVQMRTGRFMIPNVPYLIVESAIWGIYLPIFGFALWAINKNDAKTRAKRILEGTTVLLFLMSTLTFALQALETFMQLDKIMLGPEPWISTLSDRSVSTAKVFNAVAYAYNFVFSLQFLFGDGIVIWRTWVLWRGSIVCHIPIVVWIASFGLLISDRCIFIDSGAYAEQVLTGQTGVPSLSVASYALSVAANELSTALIAYRAWIYRRFMKEFLGSSGRSTAIEKILTLLVESGLIYFVIWGIDIVSNVPLDPESIVYEFSIIWSAIPEQLVGLYPTLIIALTELQRSMEDAFESVSLSSSMLNPMSDADAVPASAHTELEEDRSSQFQ